MISRILNPLRAAACCAALGLVIGVQPPRVLAHSDEYFDTRPSPHGGRTRMAGPIHIELVATPDTATLYITDHADQPQATAEGQAMLRIPSLDLRVDLAPDGENRFRARLPRALPRDARVIAFVKLATGEPQVASFGQSGSNPAAEPEHEAHHSSH